jgi:acyl carrier protein
MKDRAEIYVELKRILASEFEIDEATVSPETYLYQDLGLDSIDAIDLIVKLQETVGRKIDPETFKSVRTVEDVVTAIENILQD